MFAVYLSNFAWSAVFATVSAIVYTISAPLLSYFGKFSNVVFQFSLAVTTFSSTTVPFANTCNLMLAISYAFAASLAVLDHTFETGIFMYSFSTFTSGDGTSFSGVVPSDIFATFFTNVFSALAITFTYTNKLTSLLAFTITFFHSSFVTSFKLSYSDGVVFKFVAVAVTNSVPAGIISDTLTNPFIFALVFFNFIVYLNTSPTFTVLGFFSNPSDVTFSTVFSATMFAFSNVISSFTNVSNFVGSQDTV